MCKYHMLGCVEGDDRPSRHPTTFDCFRNSGHDAISQSSHQRVIQSSRQPKQLSMNRPAIETTRNPFAQRREEMSDPYAPRARVHNRAHGAKGETTERVREGASDKYRVAGTHAREPRQEGIWPRTRFGNGGRNGPLGHALGCLTE